MRNRVRGIYRMSAITTKDSFDELCDWLQIKTKRESPIPFDLDLVEQKIIDSLVFVEFMMLLEEYSGVVIEVDEELLGKVYSLNAIRDNFFKDIVKDENEKVLVTEVFE